MNFFRLFIQFLISLFKRKTTIEKPPAQAPAIKPVPEPPKPVEPIVPSPPPELPVEEPLPPSLPKTELEIREERSGGKRVVFVTDGELPASFNELNNNNWKGLYTAGKLTVLDFINENEELLRTLNMTDSSINVMRAVSDNEGKLEAINAYDGAFLSFGIFQWTLGTGNNRGELPALLKKIKEAYPETFEQHFGQHGIDIDPVTGTTYGFITLDGKRVESSASKEQFRSPEWVYRFWRAGHDKMVQAVQIDHALSRLKNFYWRWEVHEIPLNKLVTSEYGVGLILDNHVNLPLLVKLSLKQAMKKTGLRNPESWTDAEEGRLLEAYLQERARSQAYQTSSGQNRSTGPMHNAQQRAATTRRYVDRGIISTRRGSFQYSMIASRGIEEGAVAPPPGFSQEEYPDIEEGIGVDRIR